MEKFEEAAKSLKKSMKGIGTDENRLIKEIVNHSNVQRQEIKEIYLTMYGKSLEEDIKSETSGHFLDTLIALLEPIDNYEPKMLRKALKGLGTNEKVLIQTLCPKEAFEIENLRNTYNSIYERNLEKDIESECKGYLGRLLRSLASAGRSDNYRVDLSLAKKEAQELYDAGEGKFGTDESEFIRILCSRSFPQLNATFEEYKKVSGNDIEKAIKKEMSGDMEKACLAIVKACKNRPAYYAEELFKAMKGIGTNDETLIRLIVSRAEIDLDRIKYEYEEMYGKSLYDAVKSETSGDYKKLLLSLIGN
ncbi:unnamed protein product [Brachionus calyciflorus]|uniref:Annexin n=1 Tax=Brachionus calyciflorus TaxID=104777 RepID=A0A814HQ00_9BILA|nr:unnamed protein product [Brachionus calyciflorus]